MVDTIATEDEQVIDKLVGTLQEQNKESKEKNAELSSLGNAINRFVAMQEVNALEAEEKRLDDKKKLDDRLAKFEFKGLSDELKDNGVFKGFIGGLSFIFMGFLGLLRGLFESAFSSFPSALRVFNSIFQLQNPDKGFGFVRFKLMEFFEKIGNFFRTVTKNLFSPFGKITNLVQSSTKLMVGPKGFKAMGDFFKGISKFFGIFGKLGFALGQTLGKLFKPLTVAIAFFRAVFSVPASFERFMEDFDGNIFMSVLMTFRNAVVVFVREFIAMFVGGILDLLKLIVRSILRIFVSADSDIIKAIDSFSFADLIRDIITFFDDLFVGLIKGMYDFFTGKLEIDFGQVFAGILPNIGPMMTEEGKKFFMGVADTIKQFFTDSLNFIGDQAKKIFDRLVAFKDRTIERIKGIFDYLLKLPMAFFEGVKAAANIFGEGTVGTRFTSAFNDVMVGRDIEDTIAKPEISSDRADKIGAATGKEGGNTNTFIDQSDNRIQDQSQSSGGILQTVSDFFFGNDNDKQELAK